MADLEAVVTGLGPGPFTGLRVGVVTAAALADARGLPVIGVCSLDAVGSGARTVVTDARRKEVYWAAYDDSRRAHRRAGRRPPRGAGPPGAVRRRPGIRRAPGCPGGGGGRDHGGPAPRRGAAARRPVVRRPAGPALPAPSRRHPADRDQGGVAGMTVRLRPMTLADLPARHGAGGGALRARTPGPRRCTATSCPAPTPGYYVVAEFDEGGTTAEPGRCIGYAGPDRLRRRGARGHPRRRGRARRARASARCCWTRCSPRPTGAARGAARGAGRQRRRAQRLYKRRGFVEIGRRRGYYQPSGADAVVMKRKRVRALSRTSGASRA